MKLIKYLKVYIGSSRNINKLNGLSFQLNVGTFLNKNLQSDWKRRGESKFVIEVLESFVEGENRGVTNRKIRELEILHLCLIKIGTS
ncbi:MAG: hypothetical protein WBA54_08025 [Acidaminobacteraceae bacterium]